MSRQSNWNLTKWRFPNTAYWEGRWAKRSRKKVNSCPYRRQFLRFEWRRGYEEETGD